MYYLFRELNQFIQVRDTDLKATDWAYGYIPVWDELSIIHWGDHPFRYHGFSFVAVSPFPFLSMDISEFFTLYPEFAI